MKSTYFLPALTAVVGFAIAWVAKPTPPPTSGKEKVANVTSPASTRPTREASGSAEDGKRPIEVKAGDFPLVDQAELGPKTRDEARMLRLSEALGLNLDQQGAIISLIEAVQAKADGNVSVIQDLTTRGNEIEAELAKILNADQLAKFQELRVRERENRTEVRAQRLLTSAIEDIDLSPEQREEVLERLRQKAKADMQSIPAAATLLLDKSMLPTNNKELSVDGVLLLAQMGDETIPEDPQDAQQKVIDRQRQDLEEILRCYDGILTTGQMGQYQAAYHEQRAAMNEVVRRQAAAAAQVTEPPAPPPETIRVPEVGIDDGDDPGPDADVPELEDPADNPVGDLLEDSE